MRDKRTQPPGGSAANHLKAATVNPRSLTIPRWNLYRSARLSFEQFRRAGWLRGADV